MTVAKNHFRTTYTGVLSNSDDTNTTSGGTVNLSTLGTAHNDDAWELNIVERKTTAPATSSYGGTGSDQISAAYAQLIMNKSARCLKHYLGNTNFATAKVSKVVLTLEMKD